LKREAIA